jgi:hypothetical protein
MKRFEPAGAPVSGRLALIGLAVLSMLVLVLWLGGVLTDRREVAPHPRWSSR